MPFFKGQGQLGSGGEETASLSAGTPETPGASTKSLMLSDPRNSERKSPSESYKIKGGFYKAKLAGSPAPAYPVVPSSAPQPMSCAVTLLSREASAPIVSQCETTKITQENRDRCEDTIVIFRS